MRREAALSLCFAVLVSCHEYRTEPGRARATPPPARPSTAEHPVVPEYVAAEEPSRAQLMPTATDPDGGALVNGTRVNERGDAASDVAKPPLIGGARVPARFGKGFLFWSSKALYYAKTFLARLEPVLALPRPPSRVSFGPAQALLHYPSGGRWAIALPGFKRTALPEPGLIDLVAASDGRAVLLAEPDRVLTRAAGSSTFKQLAVEGSPIAELVADEGGIWLRRENGHALRVEGDGSATELDALPEALRAPPRWSDPHWPAQLSEGPRQRAIRMGVPLDEQTALVELQGAFVRVNLVSGKIGQIPPAALASSRECELVPLGEDALAVCRTQDGAAVISGAASAAPKIERVFDVLGSFYSAGPGTLAFGGPCAGQQDGQRAVVCVRQHDGAWRELGEPRVQGDAGTTSDGGVPLGALVTRWIPTADGGALGLVEGEDAGVYDARTNRLSTFSNRSYQRDKQWFQRSGKLLQDEVTVEPDGSLVGYTQSGALRLLRDGRIERSPHQFNRQHSAGPFALAQDSQYRLWQSTDFGQHWAEVARPTGDEQGHESLLSCSRVGCQIGHWYRLGFRSSSANHEPRDVAPPAPLASESAPKHLRCTVTGTAKTRWVTLSRTATGELTEQFDFGARKVSVPPSRERVRFVYHLESGSSGIVRAASLADLGMDEGDAWVSMLSRPQSLRFHELFGEPRLLESRFTWSDLLRVRRGGEPSSPFDSTERTAIPVLSAQPAATDGLLLLDPEGVFFWVRPGAATRAFSLGADAAGFLPVSALSRGKDELVVLAAGSYCEARVVSLSPSGTRVLFELPQRPARGGCAPNPDALALGSDGTVAVIRMPSLDAPSSDDPALALTAGAPPVRLAPWRTLGSDPCKADPSYRALIAPAESWIDAALPGSDLDSAPPLAIVRWGAQGLCLEAAELGGGELAIGAESLQTTIAARFGAKPDATRRGFAMGAEYVEPLACRLAD